MKNNNRFHVILVLVLGLASVSANAALVDRGGGLIYDTDLNITWLQDANYAQTSGYDADGLMMWQNAMDWAANLSYGGYSGWRLPTSDYCEGYNCTGSEMGHLFYTELGGVADQEILVTHNANYDLFQNIQPAVYWSGTDSPINRYSAYMFGFNHGQQGAGGIDNKIRTAAAAWAVHPGDVAAAPIPAAFWLFGSGLIGMLGFMRRRKS